MLIRNIILENFRSYKDPTAFNELSNVNVFIGPNGAGKSNVLEALKFYQGLIKGSPTRPFVEMVYDRDDTKKIVIEIHFETNPTDRQIMIEELFKKNSNIDLNKVKDSLFLSKLIHKVGISKDGVDLEEIQITQIKGDPVTILRGKRTEEGNMEYQSLEVEKKCSLVTEPIIPAKDFKQIQVVNRAFSIAVVFSNLSLIERRILNAIRQSVFGWKWVDPTRRAQPRMPLGEDFELDQTGSNLSKFLNSILGADPDKFVDLKNNIVQVLPFVERILAPPKGGEATVILGEKGLRTTIDLGNTSFGIMQTLIIVVKILTEKDDTLIAIEEPELHLHATSQRRLFKLIEEEGERKQFFLTTHSTIFTACNDCNSTYLVTKPKGATIIRKIQAPRELRTIKDILGHKNTDLFGDECIVFIEGDSEDIAFPIIAKSLGYDFAEKGIRLINLKGSGKATKLAEYLRYLKDSGVISYVIADGNKRVKEKLEDWQREGIVEPNHWTVWDLEFEDCFSLDMIADAINELMKEQGSELHVTPQQLNEAGKKGTSIVKALERILNAGGISLDKPALAEELAIKSSKDIEKKEHQETMPEREIKKIVKLVDEKS